MIMKVKINVTKTDIGNGEISNAESCPVAHALKRKLPSFMAVYDNVVLDGCAPIQVPEKVRDFIRSFDSGESVKPFSFTIDVPKKYVK